MNATLDSLKFAVAACAVMCLSSGADAAKDPFASTTSGPSAAVMGPLGTAFLYHDRVGINTSPLTQYYDLQFTLWNAAAGGTQIGSPVTVTYATVIAGEFTVQLDFGIGAFDGNPRWLEIAARTPPGSGTYYLLSPPRRPLLPVPYAMYAATAASLQLPFDGVVNAPLIPAFHVTNTAVSGGGIRGTGGDFGVFGSAAPPGHAGLFDGDGLFTGNLKALGWIGNDVPEPVDIFANGHRVMRFEHSPVGRVNVIGGFESNNVQPGVSGATIAGGGQTSSPNTASSDLATIGGGRSNTAAGFASTIGGGENNTTLASLSTVGGGLNNNAIGGISTVGGGQGNTANNSESFVGGGFFNAATGSRSVIAGGNVNHAVGQHGAVCGGINNSANGNESAVCGGDSNTAQGTSGFVGGGRGNFANGPESTVAGGSSNLASGHAATIGGGGGNEASGLVSMIPGGSECVAAGTASFAAGLRAKALHNGAFVWADDLPGAALPESTASNQMTFRASGGVRFFSNSALTTGVTLAPGGGAWAAVSDRNAKENFDDVNTRELLDRLAAIPIGTWNYKSQDPSIRHIGPMAQDFYAAFGVGEDDRRITTIDADGVALAAIQALNDIMKEKNAQIESQQAQIDNLRLELDSLRALIQTSVESNRGGER